MIPISDLNPTRVRPFVNWVLIATNIAVFLYEYSLLASGAAWVVPGYGMVPTRMAADPAGEAFTVFTSMFMHGGWEHLGGNMLFLYIFGDNVEDAVGHVRYVLFYLASGLAAAVAQILIDPSSPIPMVGASGAIAGVLGAYLVLYPRAPVTVLNPVFPLWFVFGLFLVFPAWLVVGEWFVWNLLRGLGSIGLRDEGGVAFFAHIGGFIAGLLLIRPTMTGRHKVSAQAWHGWRSAPRGGGHLRDHPDARYRGSGSRPGRWDPWR
jgi:membrane associated rhomboid family serine protease